MALRGGRSPRVQRLLELAVRDQTQEITRRLIYQFGETYGPTSDRTRSFKSSLGTLRQETDRLESMRRRTDLSPTEKQEKTRLELLVAERALAISNLGLHEVIRNEQRLTHLLSTEGTTGALHRNLLDLKDSFNNRNYEGATRPSEIRMEMGHVVDSLPERASGNALSRETVINAVSNLAERLSAETVNSPNAGERAAAELHFEGVRGAIETLGALTSSGGLRIPVTENGSVRMVPAAPFTRGEYDIAMSITRALSEYWGGSTTWNTFNSFLRNPVAAERSRSLQGLLHLIEMQESLLRSQLLPLFTEGAERNRARNLRIAELAEEARSRGANLSEIEATVARQVADQLTQRVARSNAGGDRAFLGAMILGRAADMVRRFMCSGCVDGPLTRGATCSRSSQVANLGTTQRPGEVSPPGGARAGAGHLPVTSIRVR